MFGDKAFRISLTLSITFHFFFLAPWLGRNTFIKIEKKPSEKLIAVNYLEVKIKAEPKPEKKSEKNDLLSIPTAGKIAAEKEAAKVVQQNTLIKKIEPITIESQKTEVRMGPKEPEGVYVGYYNMIRERIKSNLAKMYNSELKEGEIYLIFTLRSDGSIDKESVLDEKSTKSKELREVTLKALKKSAPFPSFPKNLT
ncbi:MAG: hypothetical protein COS99_04765, partial [Candidatus Omnitrophica bacterium CG07_land_8_20_14_0_80_42_15]